MIGLLVFPQRHHRHRPSDLLVIPGQVFVDALAAPDVLPNPLRRTMSRRLVRTHPWLDEPGTEATVS